MTVNVRIFLSNQIEWKTYSVSGAADDVNDCDSVEERLASEYIPAQKRGQKIDWPLCLRMLTLVSNLVRVVSSCTAQLCSTPAPSLLTHEH
jgi:hypothetical protein